MECPPASSSFVGEAAGSDATPSRPEPNSPALVLHTSGTTSRPKIVPLTQENLAASALHIAESLALSQRDRCLSVMPQFHIHGLIAATLAPLYGGGSISCTPGFQALQFFRWLESERPTWYTAVPTMHQTILARGARQQEAAKNAGLRFIRSSSASLPPAVFKQLTELFHCPVIESYGMTEAAHQMTSNPLPPEPQKPGTVGREAGPRVRVADSNDRLLDGDAEGEIVISGPNVTPGYLGNMKANAESFFHDETGNRWFRTGDQGRFDDEGYLCITGRIKEIINRGGEKIAPREVDDVLMEHPDVAQAVTFAMAHARLGEDVAAAVVAKEGSMPDEEELKKFVGQRLAPFKVPHVILLVDEIPKGATGKVQRIGLAKRLGLEPEGSDKA
ncbi:MAG: AMP-binding protein [Halofilum sp. (in: g-proteobacteria)]|nr:AMP-binding protein [Halofilum sp. (in: g-proteobacteria)]